MQTRAKQNVSQTDAAWAAGFLDGEGFIGVTRAVRKGTGKVDFHVAMSASQIHRAPMDKLQSMFGGRVNHQENGFRGCFHWRVSGESVYHVLRIVLPYLVVKRKQAELTLDFGTVTPSKNYWGRFISVTPEVQAHRRALWAAICELNGGRALRAERLSEKAPTAEAEGDAIVRPHGNKNHESVAETTTPEAIN